jgi:uncharacterized membrane protein
MTVLGLVAASFFCVALVLLRVSESGSTDFAGLIWNLFLAWIPFLLAVAVYDGWRRRRGRGSLVALGALWLLFFPNAPYIVVSGWIFAGVALALGSLGIYLGRFLRLNSWDALEHPSVLPRIAHAVARDPFAYQEAIGVTVLFTLALGFAYLLLYNFAVVGRELDVER